MNVVNIVNILLPGFRGIRAATQLANFLIGPQLPEKRERNPIDATYIWETRL